MGCSLCLFQIHRNARTRCHRGRTAFIVSQREENRSATLRQGKPGRLKLNPLLLNRLYLLRARSLPLHGSVLLQDTERHQPQGEIGMPKGEQKGNREKKKPKKEKIKTIAAAPSQKSVGSLQSGYGNKK
jgi:hypothetical protein